MEKDKILLKLKIDCNNKECLYLKFYSKNENYKCQSLDLDDSINALCESEKVNVGFNQNTQKVKNAILGIQKSLFEGKETTYTEGIITYILNIFGKWAFENNSIRGLCLFIYDRLASKDKSKMELPKTDISDIRVILNGIKIKQEKDNKASFVIYVSDEKEIADILLTILVRGKFIIPEEGSKFNDYLTEKKLIISPDKNKEKDISPVISKASSTVIFNAQKCDKQKQESNKNNNFTSEVKKLEAASDKEYVNSSENSSIAKINPIKNEESNMKVVKVNKTSFLREIYLRIIKILHRIKEFFMGKDKKISEDDENKVIEATDPKFIHEISKIVANGLGGGI